MEWKKGRDSIVHQIGKEENRKRRKLLNEREYLVLTEPITEKELLVSRPFSVVNVVIDPTFGSTHLVKHRISGHNHYRQHHRHQHRHSQSPVVFHHLILSCQTHSRENEPTLYLKNLVTFPKSESVRLGLAGRRKYSNGSLKFKDSSAPTMQQACRSSHQICITPVLVRAPLDAF